MTAWDESLIDWTSPADGRITLASGGATGSLSLLNGQTLTLPWKRQQEIAGTLPASIYVVDNPTTEFLLLRGPTLVNGSSRGSLYIAGWTDGTSSVGIEAGGGSLIVASGLVYSDVQMRAPSFAGEELTDTVITSWTGYDVNLVSDTEIDLTSTGIIDINATGAITIDSDSTITITTSGTGDNLVANISGAITLTATGTSAAALVANGSQASIKGTTALVQSTVGDISLTTTTGTLSVDGMLGAWTAYTPSLVQSGAVTKTVLRAARQKVGRTVTASGLLSVTGTGTANNPVVIGLPVTAAYANTVAAGSGYIYDTSGNQTYSGVIYLDTTSSFRFTDAQTAVSGGLGNTGTSFAAALAAGDVVSFQLTYESAT